MWPWYAIDGVVVPEAVECKGGKYDALQSLAFSMFSALRYLVENSQLSILNDKEIGHRMEVTKCRIKRGKLPVMFSQMLLRVIEALEVRHLQDPTTLVHLFGENGEV